MKNKKMLILVMLVLLMTGCSKANNDVKASDDANKPKNAKDVLEESVKFYENQDIKSLSIEATGEIKVRKDSKYTLGLQVESQHIFKDKKFELDTGRTIIKTIFNNKSHSVTLHSFEDGSMGYVLNNGKIYDVSDVSGMLGIKKSIPPCTNIVTDVTESPEATENVDDVDSTDAYNENETSDVKLNDTVQQTISSEPHKHLSENLLDMSNKLALKGYKEIDGKEVYVLKGIHSNNGIINSINEIIESNIYNLPTQYGDLSYEVYIDRETYEIIGMDIDMGNVIKTLSQSNEEVENIIKVKFKLNTVTQLPEVEVRKAEFDNISQIWTFMQYYTNVANSLKK